MSSQCILKRWQCYPMEPENIENHSKIIWETFFKCLHVSVACFSLPHFFALSVIFHVRGPILKYRI